MTTNAIEERIARLETKLSQAQAQKRAAEARQKAAASKLARSIDTRKKIIIGALMLRRMEGDATRTAGVRRMLHEDLTRADDRALFDLPPLPQSTTKAQKAPGAE
jgi:large subunit ribosomal protein L7/L12